MTNEPTHKPSDAHETKHHIPRDETRPECLAEFFLLPRHSGLLATRKTLRQPSNRTPSYNKRAGNRSIGLSGGQCGLWSMERSCRLQVSTEHTLALSAPPAVTSSNPESPSASGHTHRVTAVSTRNHEHSTPHTEHPLRRKLSLSRDTNGETSAVRYNECVSSGSTPCRTWPLDACNLGPLRHLRCGNHACLPHPCTLCMHRRTKLRHGQTEQSF